MKKLVILVGAVVLSTAGFAEQSNTTSNALGAAWKAQQTMNAKQLKNDIAIVYGGEDISAKPTIVEKTTTA